MNKDANTDHPIFDLAKRRWSPRAFDDREVDPETLASLFEAARWAPSCFNEQPWRYIVAPRADEVGFGRLASLLSDSNRAWAPTAGALVMALASMRFSRNNEPNRHAWYDTGQATMQLVLEATARGLAAHQMAGFDRERAKIVFGLPEDIEPVSMIAFGYPGDPAELASELAERERAPRVRRPQSDFVFMGKWPGT